VHIPYVGLISIKSLLLDVKDVGNGCCHYTSNSSTAAPTVPLGASHVLQDNSDCDQNCYCDPFRYIESAFA
jgi:hypothetical protein